ncbi:MAG TPA: S41 family peptidase [Candidatus Fermentibacter daniensis]|nr:S41 family peptidase [Candidatus Fermentibacter daniensis]HOI36842.1 S41 family peptidase [Bacillota bacterium]HOR08336.1 S41 family peptidase [Candidatus Fermentibacter daniensis]HOZ18407.1 S41 family peptidase [Candidatus Fermentibacter daniensis]HPK52763.1 S41 family peptidase [Candidatus Fermentibacter daniensis]
MSNKTLVLMTIPFLSLGCIDNPATTDPPDRFASEFQLVWDLFDSEYVGFEVKGVDWDAVYEQYRPMADTISSRAGMTDLTLSMLSRLEDYHVRLIDPANGRILTYDPVIVPNYDLDVLMDYLEPWGFLWMQSGKWGYCLAGPDSIPYFVITAWDSNFNISLFDDLLQQALDRPGLIIDVRMNPGGSEAPVENVVRRFVDELQVGYLWQERIGADTHELTPPEPHKLRPRSWFFGNPVIVLAGSSNADACELFVCEMAEIPRVTVIGDTTMGAVNWPSSYWELPDNWYMTCPIRTVLRPDTTVIEGAGIPPDIFVEATEEDFSAGIDPVLLAAFEQLGALPPAR